MTDALEDHEGTDSIGGRSITNLRFTNDIDEGWEEEELAELVECLDKACTAYGMAISAEKTRLMTNNTSGINKEMKFNGQKFETVTCFKDLGSVVSDEGSKPEIFSRIAETTTVFTRLKPVWNGRTISLSSKIRLMHPFSACLWIMDPHSRAPKKNTSHGNEVLPQDTTHLM